VAVDDPDIPDVVISKDWRYITIYLDGSQQNAQTNNLSNSRLMTTDTARKGFDFFEVVFFAGGEPTVRQSWDIGKRALIEGVPRGVNYSRLSLDYSGAPGQPPSGDAAILFVGRKRDKTLLAVGKVVSVDDVPGTFVSNDSSFVTFEIFAITGKLNNDEEKTYFSTVSYDANESCFLTAYKDPTGQTASVENTEIIPALIGGRPFPLYKLPEGKASVKASYQFELDGAKWADFAGGVLVANVHENNGTVCGTATIRIARYPAGNNRYWYPMYPLDITTNVKMTNNGTNKLGKPVENRLEFEFDTSKSIKLLMTDNEIGVFTLGFRIPVSPLLVAERPGFVFPYEGEEDMVPEGDVTWFIRPAYQSYYYNIDSGLNEYGGGVLMGVFSDYDAEFDVGRKSS
jgi:hypothetical protein